MQQGAWADSLIGKFMPPQDDILKKIKRYYLFHGPNDYKLDERVSSLISTLISPGSEAFDLDRFYGKVCEISDVINAVSTPPVISALRVTVLRDVDKTTASEQARLDTFLSKIPPYSVLAMTAGKIDKRSKFFKRLASEDKAHSFFFDTYKADEAMAMVMKFALDKGKKMSSTVAAVIVETYGTDPYRLGHEVEKAVLFVGDKSEIEKRDLALASGFDRVETAYDLPDLILDGKIDEALELARRAIASGISEVQLLYILKTYLLGLNTALTAGSIRVLMSIMHVGPDRARILYSRSKNISQRAVQKGLAFTFRAEYSLKSARFPSEAVIELLITALHLTFRGNISRDRLYLV
jgi:DNA polymerase-3 subunit delta